MAVSSGDGSVEQASPIAVVGIPTITAKVRRLAAEEGSSSTVGVVSVAVTCASGRTVVGLDEVACTAVMDLAKFAHLGRTFVRSQVRTCSLDACNFARLAGTLLALVMVFNCL